MVVVEVVVGEDDDVADILLSLSLVEELKAARRRQVDDKDDGKTRLSPAIFCCLNGNRYRFENNEQRKHLLGVVLDRNAQQIIVEDDDDDDMLEKIKRKEEAVDNNKRHCMNNNVQAKRDVLSCRSRGKSSVWYFLVPSTYV